VTFFVGGSIYSAVRIYVHAGLTINNALFADLNV